YALVSTDGQSVAAQVALLRKAGAAKVFRETASGARLAEFERELIRARTGEGRRRAVARGVKMGRKPKLTPQQMQEAIRRRDRGEETLREIARSYNVSHSTISRLQPQVAP
ncbi:MAG: helix-turn-helix domain-containing protein, partial [Acidobacteria bacterium]|nr:helix-turn-helix domain-containing protein [Acidobacteriota bacterium]